MLGTAVTLDMTDCEMEQEIVADCPELSENGSVAPCRMLVISQPKGRLISMV